MGYLVMLFYDERTFIYRDITVLVIFSLKLFREMSCLVFLPLGSESDGRIHNSQKALTELATFTKYICPGPSTTLTPATTA